MCEYQEATRHRFPSGAAAPAPFATGRAETGNSAEAPCRRSTNAVLSDPEMVLDPERAALAVIDPRIGSLDPDGAAWPPLGNGIIDRGTIHNLARLLGAAKQAGATVAISLTAEDRREPGSAFLPELEQYIGDGETIICSPHTRYSPLPRINDIGLQLRKRRVEQVILAGLITRLCIEAHLRDLLEQGFQVAVVRDAVAGPRLPEGNGYLPTLVNFRRIAQALWTTDDAVAKLGGLRPGAACGNGSEQSTRSWKD